MTWLLLHDLSLCEQIPFSLHFCLFSWIAALVQLKVLKLSIGLLVLLKLLRLVLILFELLSRVHLLVLFLQITTILIIFPKCDIVITTLLSNRNDFVELGFLYVINRMNILDLAEVKRSDCPEALHQCAFLVALFDIGSVPPYPGQAKD